MHVPDTGDDWWSRSTPVSAICLTIGCPKDEMTCVAIDGFPTIHRSNAFKLMQTTHMGRRYLVRGCRTQTPPEVKNQKSILVLSADAPNSQGR